MKKTGNRPDTADETDARDQANKADAADTPVNWSVLADGDWNLHIAAVPEGLCYVGSPGRPPDELAEWAAARQPGRPLQRNDAALLPYAEALSAYLRGALDGVTVPLALRGTPFQLAVWQELRRIPYGETRSYTDIAVRIGRPASTRAVGAAIGANPVLLAVPCHRVIGKNGALTGYRGGLDMKVRLLQLERQQPERRSLRMPL